MFCMQRNFSEMGMSWGNAWGKESLRPHRGSTFCVREIQDSQRLHEPQEHSNCSNLTSRTPGSSGSSGTSGNAWTARTSGTAGCPSNTTRPLTEEQTLRHHMHDTSVVNKEPAERKRMHKRFHVWARFERLRVTVLYTAEAFYNACEHLECVMDFYHGFNCWRCAARIEALKLTIRDMKAMCPLHNNSLFLFMCSLGWRC